MLFILIGTCLPVGGACQLGEPLNVIPANSPLGYFGLDFSHMMTTDTLIVSLIS